MGVFRQKDEPAGGGRLNSQPTGSLLGRRLSPQSIVMDHSMLLSTCGGDTLNIIKKVIFTLFESRVPPGENG
jgi:hypothetical protein